MYRSRFKLLKFKPKYITGDYKLYNKEKKRIVVGKSISHLEGTSLVFYVLSNRGPYQRLITLNVDVTTEDAVNFLSDIYFARIANDAKPEREIHFNREIALHQTANYTDVHYTLMSAPPNRTAFTLINRKRIDGNIAQLYLSRRPLLSDLSNQSFYIGAMDRHTQRCIAMARIDILFETIVEDPPKFEASRYFTSRSIVLPHATVLRVTARLFI
ncbi:unnamed protein product [Toxocara canis]|uniref:Cadherin domain-containing protein n=1 Tax=Toxocara canis TaxID=6265 RepID=A0A183VE50_TOXCA|nr:unnamed protein product [Toxocara canis]